MRGAKLPLIALAVIVAASAAQEPVPPPAQDTPPTPDSCTVQGTVVAAATGVPLKSAQVTLATTVTAEERAANKIINLSDRFRSFTEVADSNGHFVITGVPAGTYTLRAEKAGYVPEGYRLIGGRPTEILKLAAGDNVDKIQFQLTRAAVIIGRVTDEAGEPVAGVEMDALVSGLRMGDWIPANPGKIAVTNDLGEYRIYDLPPASYYVSATDTGSPEYMTSPNTWRRESNHPTLYYPGVTRSGEAQKIRVRAGQETRIDFSLRPVKLLTVSGRVFDVKGKPAAQANVRFLPLELEPTVSHLSSKYSADAKGSFAIRDIPPGSYMITASSSDALNESEEDWTGQPVEVAGDNVSGLELHLRKTLKLSGKVIAVGESKSDFRDLRIMLRADALPLYTSDLPASGELNKDGTFTIDNVRPTRNTLSVYPLPDGWYLYAASFGSQNVLEDGLQLAGADPEETLKVTLSHAAGQIKGVVFKGDDPVRGAVVRLFQEPVNPHYPDAFEVAKTDEGGNFIMPSIAPGSYRAVAYASEYTDGNDDDSPPDETHIILAEKETKTVQLRLDKTHD